MGRADSYVGSIVKTQFPYFDSKSHSTKFKARPFLIVSAETEEFPCDFTAFPISKVSASKHLNEDFDIKIEKEKYPKLNLDEDVSYIRIHKIQTINSSNVAVKSISSLIGEYPELYVELREKFKDFSENLF